MRVTDPFGNTVLSSASQPVTIGSATTDAYAASVLANNPVAFWPLSEPAGSALGDRVRRSRRHDGCPRHLRSRRPHPGSSAVSFQGDPSSKWGFSPPITLIPPTYSTSTAGTASTATPLSTYSLEAWVKTTSPTGGLIVGDGLWQSGDSWVDDRVLYFDTHGDLEFGAYNNGPTNAGLDQAIASPTPYNDGFLAPCRGHSGC